MRTMPSCSLFQPRTAQHAECLALGCSLAMTGWVGHGNNKDTSWKVKNRGPYVRAELIILRRWVQCLFRSTGSGVPYGLRLLDLALG